MDELNYSCLDVGAEVAAPEESDGLALAGKGLKLVLLPALAGIGFVGKAHLALFHLHWTFMGAALNKCLYLFCGIQEWSGDEVARFREIYFLTGH
jgi:hypothetical protein